MNQYDGKSPTYPVTQVTPLRHDEFGIDNNSFRDYDSGYRPDTQSYYERKSTPGQEVKPISSPPEDADLNLNYKPTPLKWPFLVAILLAVAALIGATEYACRALPAEVARGSMPTATTAKSSITPSPMAPGTLLLRQAQATNTGPSQTTPGISDSISTPSSDQDVCGKPSELKID